MKDNSTLSDKLKNRLKAYSLTAGAIAAGVSGAQAQIDYTDLDPDGVADGVDTVFLDLNNDGTDDFKFYVLNGTISSGYIDVFRGFVLANSNNAVVGSATGSFLYPYSLSPGSLIDKNQDFQAGTFQTLGWDYFYYGSTSSALGTYGNIRWGGGDAYIGLRLEVDGATHYGWARVELQLPSGNLIVKDYAYEETACLGILAAEDVNGQTPASAPIATNVVATDNGNVGDGSDLTVTYDVPASEDGVMEYRILVVKEASSTGFDLATAQAVDMANYTSIAPTGNNINETLTSTSNDVDGDGITKDTPYRVFVMSVADCDNAQMDALAASSDTVTLAFPASVGEINNLGYSMYANGNEIIINAQKNINRLMITSVDGKVVRTLQNVRGNKTIQVNEAAGVYIVTVETDNGQKAEKLFLK